MKIVFDIGGSKIRIATSIDGRNLSEPIIVRTPQRPEEAIKKLITLIEDASGSEPIEAIGGGLPGVLNEQKSALNTAQNLPKWIGFPIVEKLHQHFNRPIYLENDTVLGGLGEANLGAGKGFKQVLYIAVGTGLGGSWMVNGQLAGQGSFEPGHQIIDFKTLTNWEYLVDNSPTPKEQVHFLAVGLFNCLLMWPSEIVVLGGGKTFHKGWSLQQLSDELSSLSKNYFTVPKIKIAGLNDMAGLWGALYLLKNKPA